eukprot:s5_g74.t1
MDRLRRLVGAPGTESARLAICEIDDRIRIVKPAILCGSATADSMDTALVERTRPYGAPEVESSEVERWLDVEFLKMGFYKICWCSGMFSCVSGADFTFLIGFAVITGEMRTVAGNGTEPMRNVDEWEERCLDESSREDGLTLYWAEPHRVREANLVNGSVRTLRAGNCIEPGFVCGDGLPGTSARLNDPRGLAVCRGELLIADHMKLGEGGRCHKGKDVGFLWNSRIRAYDFETGIITTKVGTDHGYSGDGGAPNLAKLSGPTGVVCDDLRGYWIADTGNSAIRGVRVSPGQSDVISTVVGGLGQGLATPGTWSSQAQLDHPMQLATLSRRMWGAPRSLTYVENYNAVARFLPLGSSVMEGAVQQVIGTGSTGHTTTANKKNIMMNRPEGIAVHSSTVFVSDTMNHRIIMVPILEYEPLGCYKEVTIEGESTLIPSLEGDLEAGLVPAQICRDEVLDVADAVARCARATIRKAELRRAFPFKIVATMRAINESCHRKGGHYAGYTCQVVSWDDVSRGETVNGLSCWGSNITDTYLKSRTSGTPLFTLRSANWNERLGVVSAERVAVVAGGRGGDAGALRPVTLKRVLQELGHHGSYAGLAKDSNLYVPETDVQCSIRFQTTFLPVEAAEGEQGKLEFATEAYNYHTLRDDDPRNLVLLCTTQGMAVQQDGRGTTRLFHHALDEAGKIHRYWLEAEESEHKVGGAQPESAAERAAALRRKKATSSVIGIEEMGQRFNVLMTIQVPLQQKATLARQPCAESLLKSVSVEKDGQITVTTTSYYCQEDTSGAQKYLLNLSCDDRRARSRSRCRGSTRGRSSAARVSRGTEHDVWPGLSVKSPKRKSDEHVTITVVMYHALRGGVPCTEDVTAAIDDLEALYAACSANGRLADDTFDFAKKPLKVEDVIGISEKVHFQPPSEEVLGFERFPL